MGIQERGEGRLSSYGKSIFRGALNPYSLEKIEREFSL
jgi:hypothetical protein